MDPTDPVRKRYLSPREQRFVDSYCDPQGANGNGRAAAGNAGYKGGANQLAVQSSRLLRRPAVWQAIEDEFEAQGCIPGRAAQVIAESMRATKRRSFLHKDGSVVYADAEPDHAVRLQGASLYFRLKMKLHLLALEEQAAAGDVEPGAIADNEPLLMAAQNVTPSGMEGEMVPSFSDPEVDALHTLLYPMNDAGGAPSKLKDQSATTPDTLAEAPEPATTRSTDLDETRNDTCDVGEGER